MVFLFQRIINLSTYLEEFLCSPKFENLNQIIDTDGFGNVIVHPGFQALLPVATHGIGGHGNDVGSFDCFIVENNAGSFISIHFRHLNIHENQIVIFTLERIQHLQSIGCDIHLISKQFKYVFDQLLIDNIIFSNKDLKWEFFGNFI